MANFITIDKEETQETFIQNKYINDIKKARNETFATINEENTNNIPNNNPDSLKPDYIEPDYTTDILFNTNIKRDTSDLFEGIKETYVLDNMPEKWEDGGL